MKNNVLLTKKVLMLEKKKTPVPNKLCPEKKTGRDHMY